MQSLPTETWIKIVKDHSNLPAWLALSSTSSFFRPIAQGSLYRRIKLWSDLGSEDSAAAGSNRAFIQFAKSLRDRPKLGEFVRSLHLESGSEEYEDFALHPFLHKAGLFPHLVELTLGGFHINASLCVALRSRQFPCLDYINFDSCCIASNQPNVHLRTDAGSLISTLAITNPYTSSPEDWSSITPTGTQKLYISMGIWARRPDGTESYEDAMMSMLMTQGRTHSLTKLVLESTYPIPANFIPFLESSPQIRSLSLPLSIPRDIDLVRLGPLSPSTIPNLEEFRGSAELSRIFVPGRPVHAVRVSLHPGSPTDVLLPLQLSTSLITELKFVYRDYIYVEIKYGSFLQYAPISLIRFGWRYATKTTLLSCVPALSRFGNLNAVKGGYLNTKGSHAKHAGHTEIVQKFSEACPSIREFNFMEERWLARKQSGWERYLSK